MWTATEVSLTTQFPVNVTADLPGGGTLKLNGKVGPVDPTDAVLTPLNADLNIGSAEFDLHGLSRS